MEKQIPGFMTYLMQVKNASKSTMSSYERDLKRLAAFLAAKGDSCAGGRDSHLFEFLYPFPGTGRFFHSHGFQKCGFYESPFFTMSVTRDRRLQRSALARSARPRIDRKAPEILTVEEVESLLEQPDPGTMPKGIRDKAMLELLYATGMRVTELITLKTDRSEPASFLCDLPGRGTGACDPIWPESPGSIGNLSGIGPERASEGRRQCLSFCELLRSPYEPPGFLEADQAIRGKGWDRDRYHAPYHPPFICCSSGAERSRSEGGPGDDGACRYRRPRRLT